MGYRDEIYGQYLTRVIAQVNELSPRHYEGLHRYYQKNYAQYLPADKEAPILDCGCGPGQFLFYLQRAGYVNYLGIDISEECVRFCREMGFNAEQADIMEYLSGGSSRFQAIVLNDVIEHFDKDEAVRFLRACRENLKVGGVLIVKTPNMGCPLNASFARYCDFTHETGFTDRSLEAVLSAVGFRELKVVGPDVYTSANPLVNFVGTLGFKLLSVLFRCVHALYGDRRKRVLTRNLLAVASR